MSLPLNQPLTLTFHSYSDSDDTTLADATTVQVDILDPTGTTTSYTLAGAQVAHAGTGTYSFTYLPAATGHYEFHWHSTGTAVTSLDGSFDVDAIYTNVTVSPADFALYLNNDAAKTDPRAAFILAKAQQLCETIVNPLPAGADIVILDVAERAYANPATVGGTVALYAEGEGPFSDNAPGTTGGGLYLTQNNIATLRRLTGTGGGAFTIDTTPALAGTGLPWWDTGAIGYGGDWDMPT